MKNISYLLIVIVSLSLSSCYDLDTSPGDKVPASAFYKTEAHVKQALMGIYAEMKVDQAFGLYFMFDNLGETAYGYDAQAYNAAFLGSYTARTAFVQDRWSALYDGIRRANAFISNVSATTAINDTQKGEYIAEAKFLRALFYFALLDFYGGVPYYDETTDVNADFANMKNPRSSASDIRGYIISDLDEAIAKLKPTVAAADYGRATKGSAYALRGKVYLYNKEWPKAISDFEEIVYNKTDNYGYVLYPDYKELFALYNGKKSNEMIFAIQNIGSAGNTLGMKLDFYLGTRNSFGSCWNNSVPSCDLVDMYEYPDGKPFNWDDVYPGYNAGDATFRRDLLNVKLASDGKSIESLMNADTAKILNTYKNRDPRLMATAIVPYSNYIGWNSNATRNMLFVLNATTGGSPNESNGFMRNNSGSWVTYFWRKFVPESNLGGAITDRAHTPFEFPLIRLADVLLMLSEAYNENDQLDKAVVELNKVRARTSVNMPGLNSGPSWMAVTSKDDMTTRIRKERAIELAAEGHRFSDLRRWGIAKDVLAKRPARNIYGGVQYTHEFVDRDWLWPIPGVEIERNPAIEQNPNWQ